MKTAAVFLFATMITALGGCGELNPASYRFRMTIEVATPSGIRTGSGVLEESAYVVTRLTSEDRSGGGGLKGEAVVVDLPTGPVFALLRTRDGGQAAELSEAVTQALAGPNAFNDTASYVATVRRLGDPNPPRKAELPRETWPSFVQFGNIDDPRTLKRVDPATLGVRRVTLMGVYPLAIRNPMGYMMGYEHEAPHRHTVLPPVPGRRNLPTAPL